MNDKRTHRQDSTLRDKTLNKPMLLYDAGNVTVRQHTKDVRSRHDAKRSVVCGGCIKVDS